MNGMKGLIAVGLTLALSSNWVFAQGEEGENGDLDVTITAMPQDAEVPEVVTGDITLPMDEDGNYIPAEEGVENSAEGLAIANEAREDGRAFGEAAAAAAEANREDLGRGSMPNLEELIPADLIPDQVSDTLGDDVSDLPERPDVPVTPGG